MRLRSLSILLGSLVSFALLGACSAGGGGTVPNADGTGPGGLAGAGGGSGGSAGSGGGVTDGLPLATNVSISGVNIYQAVSVPLMQNGTAVAQHNAPVVIGKDAMIRVFVAPGAGFQPRQLVAELDLTSASAGSIAPMQVTLQVNGPSDESNLGSTFDFDVPGADITGDLAYAVSIRESTADAQFPGATDGATFPADGSSAPMGAEDSHGNFKVTILPFQYQADGSGRLPDTSEAQLDIFKEKFTAYPVPGTDFTVHAPVAFSTAVTNTGNGWSDFANMTCQVRLQDGAPKDNFYYGVIVPADSFFGYCGGGCVAGLGTQAQPTDDWARCAVGLGYSGEQTANVALQELGHALGRLHAPCGVNQAVDNAFPYPGAGLGKWGYELPKKLLQDPGLVKDFMSYCTPVWVSDYTFSAIFDRISFVNSNPMMFLPADFPDRWRTFAVGVDGSLHAGASVHLRTPPTGSPRTVYLLDAAGKAIGSAPGFYYAADTVAGGTMLVPDDALAGAKTVRLAGRVPVAL